MQRFDDESAHLGDLGIGGGDGMIGPPVAHDIAAERGVGDLCADVHDARHRFECVEVLGEALPRPLDAFVQRSAGNVLDAFHQVDEPLTAVGFDRREPYAAVSHDCGGHAVPRRRRDIGVPRGLAVVVRVNIHPARGDQQAIRVKFGAARTRYLADDGDDSVVDGDIRRSGRSACAVDHGAPANYQVVRHSAPSSQQVSLHLRTA